MPARLGLTLAQSKHVGQTQANRQLVQGILLDQVGTHTGQVALRQLAQLFIEQASHRQVQDGIAQKLDAFVVVGRKAAVRECLQQ